MLIRKLLFSEIDLLKDFPPKEWNLDLPALVLFHFEHPYFYPAVVVIDGKIVGFGNGILNGKVGWLGNIIVLPEMRKQGIGNELTNHLVEYFKNMGCASQLLIASEMGKNIYSKIGFRTSASYQFFKRVSGLSNYQKTEKIRKVETQDFPALKMLDEEATGEKRSEFIERYFTTGWVYSSKNSKEIEGTYFSDLGGGLIIAKNSEAGIELIKFRLSQGKTAAIVPSENEIAIKYLMSEGFQLTQSASRMVLGEEVNWKPKFIFNRGGGYCG